MFQISVYTETKLTAEPFVHEVWKGKLDVAVHLNFGVVEGSRLGYISITPEAAQAIAAELQDAAKKALASVDAFNAARGAVA